MSTATGQKMIFVNLPVTDLARATAFYVALGAKKDDRFSDDTATCIVFSETIHVMLLTHEKFSMFTTKAIPDAKRTAQMLLCISAESRTGVDELIGKAGSAGGVTDPSPQQDYGSMYGRSFEDPDGHLWEVIWMDVEAFLAAHSQAAA